MKVVFLNSTGQLGGAENVLLDVLASLCAARPAWSLHLIAAADGLLVERARAHGITTTVLPFPQTLARLGDAGAGGPAGQSVKRATLARRFCESLPATARYLRDLRRTLRRLDPDVIHTNGLKMHALGAWAQTPRASVLWHIHDYVGSRPFASRVLRASARGCAAVVANSESVAADVRAVLMGKGLDVWAMHNAVNVERFAPDGNRIDLDALSGLPPAAPGTVRVGLVATLARWKGHDTFLRALSLLPTDSPVRGYVAGDALYQTDGSQYALEELRRMADDLGVAGRVGFTGFVEDAASVMRALDVVVHASTEPEPFGLVIAEAMACGRAVVASNAGGAAEFIRTGENALGHAPGDAAGLAARISQLAHDAHLRAALGRAGRSTALQRFDRTRLAAQLIPVYEELRSAECGVRIAGTEATTGDAPPHQSTISNLPSESTNPTLSTNTTQASAFDISATFNPHSALRTPQSVCPQSAILKVLHVHSGNLYGGVETMLATLARERGLCPELEPRFALCFEGRLRDELAATGARVDVLGAVRVRRPASVLRARRALVRMLAEESPDVLVCHSAWTAAVFGASLRASRVPLVFWMHAPASGTHWLERLARRTTPALVICNSRWTAESVVRLYPRVQTEVVYCPVSTTDASAHISHDERAAVRAELDTPESATVIVQVGRMESLKGHAVHLEALGMLRDVPGWFCWQIGGAQRPSEVEYVEKLKRLAARLGISERIRFSGERADVGRLLAAADIYCQPNVAPESFGLTFAEALRARLPVVTTAIGGAREIVNDTCGVLVPDGDPRALAASLRTLLDDATLRHQLGSHGPARARELCEPSARLKQLNQLFSSIC